MRTLRLALIVAETNEYQRQQSKAARATAQQLGVELKVVAIQDDAIVQSQQVLQLLQAPKESRPDGILFEPVGTPLSQAARLAASSGVGWVILNRDADYLVSLRASFPKTPMFSVSTSHNEVGRIQGQQMRALLPDGGIVLLIQGPSSNPAASQRTTGLEMVKPASIELRTLRGHWSEQSGYKVVSQWLQLSTSQRLDLKVVAAQNDAMALGALKAFQEFLGSPAGSSSPRNIAFLGCDGLPDVGQAAVRQGLLAATVVTPANAGDAVDILVRALRTGIQPEESTLTNPVSYPPTDSLSPR
jgi:ribose transport system substrate-binding protein